MHIIGSFLCLKDDKLLCVLCAFKHKQKHPDHPLKFVLNKAQFQMITKKNEGLSDIIKDKVDQMMRKTVDTQVAQLNATFRSFIPSSFFTQNSDDEECLKPFK